MDTELPTVRTDYVTRLLEAVWYGSLACPSGKSWVTLNGVMREAVYLAIRARMKFPKRLFQELKMGREHWSDVDGWYKSAVDNGNVSACVAIEIWRGWVPLLCPEGNRLALGSQFRWEGSYYVVTSWVDGGLRAKWNGGKARAPKGKVLIKLTRAQLAEARAKVVAADKAIVKAEKEGAKALLAAGWSLGEKYRGRPQRYIPPGDQSRSIWTDGLSLEAALLQVAESKKGKAAPKEEK